jgi:DNA-binding transcriptional regulator LsrR (DeoR family)
VGRHLKRARELGLVEITIRSPLEFAADLELALERTFNLEEVIVVSPRADTEASLKEALGEAGAAMLARRVQPGDVIGVSWSSTLLQCAVQLEQTAPRRVIVVQMNGSLDRTSYSTRAEFILDRIAHAFGGTTVPLLAPLFVDRPAIKASLLSDSHIAATLKLARTASLALFGVGDLSRQSSLYKAGYLDDAQLKRLTRDGAVGDICGQFFNSAGEACARDLAERTVAIDLDDLRAKSLAVAIAGGNHKVEAVRGMLRGRFCSVLITDRDTARTLLEPASRRKS